MNQIILNDYRQREATGQLRLIPSESGRTGENGNRSSRGERLSSLLGSSRVDTLAHE